MTEHFFIVGAQRCGTTYLYHLLAGHPEIEMAVPVRPEPKFFLDDALYEKGLDHYERTFFSGKPGARVRGEKSTSYLEYEKVAERISGAFPDASILVVVRDPVARAMSHWRFSTQNGVESLSMEEAFRQEPERIKEFDRKRFSVSPFAYLGRGRYIDYILPYARHFPRERIKVITHEALVGPGEPFREIYGFLGVDQGFTPSGVGEPVNKSAPAAGRDALSPELLAHMLGFFEESNRRLADWAGLDLSGWGAARGEAS